MAQDQGFEQYPKPTRRDVFLETMDRIMPWEALCAVVEPFYPKPGDGRRQRIRQCRGQWTARQESLTRELLVGPAQETVDQRLGFGQSHGAFGGAGELLLAYLRQRKSL
jgi:hypothetical protein